MPDSRIIGVSGEAWLDRKPFKEVYPYLPKSHAFLTLDVGLIAGISAHYVGDACQPLHGSELRQRLQDQTEEKPTSTGKTKNVWPAQGVHSAHEDKRIDDHTTELFDGIEALSESSRKWPTVTSGHEAAVAIVTLMAESQRLLPRTDTCNEYIKLGGGTSKATIEGLWKKFSKPSMQTMYNGASVLSLVWEGAWAAGGGDKLAASKLKEITEAALEKRDRDANFVESLDLDSIKSALARSRPPRDSPPSRCEPPWPGFRA